MLKITIPGKEMFNEETQEFFETKSYTIQLEHSLVSVSKWESKWNKPFLGKQEKTVEETNKPLCESRTLFDGTGRLVDTVKNKKNLVGFEIIPVRAKGVTTKINKICLQFTKAGEYTLYLMHSSMDAPVKIIKLNKIRDNSIVTGKQIGRAHV